MYLYSIDGLHTTVKQTDYYKGKGNKIKPVLLDKVNFLIDAIIKGNRHHWELSQYKPIPLHHKILRKMMGRYENETIIELLQEMDILQVNHSYTSTGYANKLTKQGVKSKPESKKYGLTDTAKTMKVIKVGVLSERMEKKILQYKKELINHYLKDNTIHSKIIYNLTNLRFNPSHPEVIKALNEVDTDTDQGKYYQDTYKALQELNQYNFISQYMECPHFYYTQSKNVNRVFHYYSTIPKPYRESLTLKNGTTLAEIDLKNSQPLIIGLNYIRSRNGKLTDTDTDLLNDIVGGNFYKRIADYAYLNEDVELYNLYHTDYSKFKATILGQGLYFQYLPLENIKDAEKYLLELYPNFMKYLREKKRIKGYKTVSIEAQQIESSIFINGLFKNLTDQEFAVPVHDSIMVKSGETDQYLDKLVYIFRRKFPFLTSKQVQDLFRVTQYN